ncbi:HAMP domain-containing protein [Streptomyces sp. ms191]|uniref:sensor histidine kinase n=1 Tax=Streptomyces sp. ms191 TaxID=1827978 RepID=UPI0011CDF7FE|nr:nitrate- and nitrite sensing domain-containing protein [Streptomyces sp. ms191]TXS21067.1 HAMP domain-containing protein [Streptomyces sp. ms191]
MRAPVQKKRPRTKNGTPSRTPGDPLTTGNAAGPGADGASAVPAAPPVGRPKRVRNRLVAGVALVGVTVLAAGAPAVLTASGELTDSQRLVTLAELDRQAVTLAHSLADERDEVVAYIAAGRDEQDADDKKKRQVTSTRSARVDRQIDEIRPAATADLRRDLAGLTSIRRTALTGKGTALEAHRAYSEVIGKLQALADELAEKTPARAAEATRAPGDLGRAVEQASAVRGLLLAALAVPRPESTGTHYDPISGTYVPDRAEGAEEAERQRNALTAAAQQSRVREQAALADFDQSATAPARDSLAATVTGPDVKNAERYLTRLADQPELSTSERKTDPEKLEAALSARIEQMRGVESALATQQVERLAQLRDDDVTALELRIAFLGGCLLVAVGISTFVARTLTRPLAVLRIGAARLSAAPETEEPVRFTGRNDEFAQVVRSLNTLQGKLAALALRAEQLDSERADQAGAREALAVDLAAQRAELQGQTALLSAELTRLRDSVQHTFVNLSLRSLGLVERQLGVIEKLEEREQDPDRLATLFKLDHMATVMRRHSENLLVLAGHEHVHGHAGPVPLVDVLRAAVSEIERYERVAIQSLPPHAQIAGFAADDLSHLVAELLENATSFSPPDAQVQLSGWVLESGEVMLSVQDEGIGMTASRLAELNARLAEADPADTEGEGLGLRVAALLAARHGVRVELREQKQGGIAAVVVLPPSLLPTAPPTAVPATVQVAGAAPTLNLPGSVAEANSNALPSRARDPFVEAAEQAIEAAGTTGTTPATEPAAEPLDESAPATGASAPLPPAAGTTDPADAAQPAGPLAADEPAAERAWQPAQEPARAEPTPEAESAATADTTAESAHTPATVPAQASAPELESPTGAEESVSETTLQVRLPDLPAEPDSHERAVEEQPPARQAQRLTDKGLPKRTPQIVRQADAPVTPRTGGVDAEALRRRLGGFHRGAEKGRQDVEAEIEAGTAPDRHEAAHAARTEEKTGDTVEEARS